MSDRPNTALGSAIGLTLLAGLLLAGWLGAPPELLRRVLLLTCLVLFLVAGLSQQSMRPSLFLVAGRGLTVGTGALPLVLLMLALSDFSPANLASAAAGCAVYGAVAAAPLQRAGGYSFSEVVAVRFGSRSLAVLVAGIAAIFLTALAARLMPHLITSLARATSLPEPIIRFTVLLMVAAAIIPGGLISIVLCGLFGVFALLVFGFLPAALLAVTTGIGSVSTPLGHAMSQSLAATEFDFGLFLTTIALFIATGLSGSFQKDDTARQTTGFALLLVLLLTLPANLNRQIVTDFAAGLAGKTVLQLPARIYDPSAQGSISMCGVSPRSALMLESACAKRDFRGPIPADQIVMSPAGNGHTLAVATSISGLLGQMEAIGLPLLHVLALALLCHLISTLLVHDLLYRGLELIHTASARLMLHRVAALMLVGGLIFLPEPRLAFLGTLWLPAEILMVSTILPLFALSLWSRADWRAALCGMGSALLVIAAGSFHVFEANLTYPGAILANALASAAAVFWFRQRSEERDMACDVLTGHHPGPLMVDRSA